MEEIPLVDTRYAVYILQMNRSKKMRRKGRKRILKQFKKALKRGDWFLPIDTAV